MRPASRTSEAYLGCTAFDPLLFDFELPDEADWGRSSYLAVTFVAKEALQLLTTTAAGHRLGVDLFRQLSGSK